MEQIMNLQFASSLTDICEINSSFDRGLLRVAYTGTNKNGSDISKEAFERAIPSMYNCPIVCHYDEETDSFGGHDVAIKSDANGELRLVNLTTPIGVIPESAKYSWGSVTEEDGTEHEYLYVEALLWKRQQEYRKLVEDGVSSHSMEIYVKDGVVKDGVYTINDFEFRAFAIIGVEPCFESSALDMNAKSLFSLQFSEMMRELKDSIQAVTASFGADNTHPQEISTEGGNEILEEKMNLAANYGIDVDKLDFSLDDFTVEELEEKFKAMQPKPEEAQAAEPEVAAGEPVEENKFELNNNVMEELRNAVRAVKIQTEWGPSTAYWFVDFDAEKQEVYVEDNESFKLYGCPYTKDGDTFKIDFGARRQKKWAIVDFDEGSGDTDPMIGVFAEIRQAHDDELKAFTDRRDDAIRDLNNEIEELREFKAGVETERMQAARNDVFAKFSDLDGIEAFETLRDDCGDLSVEELEEKCFAIRGRNMQIAAFTAEQHPAKIAVEKIAPDKDAPYGGIVERYLGHQ